ncbi:hypothetical protein [Streptomyces sp. NPDC001530]|uniref:hypothetical protein n=1 Tax=Streptomyces sp. NPDC001530 TaxID=3364582 RepID=UPI0036ADB382
MKTTRPRRTLAWAAVPATLSAMLLTGCNPHMYDSVQGVSDVRPTEVVGTWHCVDGTRITLKPDGKAVITLLDGQEFDFYDRWRLSGTGTWQLTDADAGWSDGQHVRLSLADRTAVEERHDPKDAPTDSGNPAPERYTWTLETDRDKKGRLALFFLFGDPDSRSLYMLEKLKK